MPSSTLYHAVMQQAASAVMQQAASAVVQQAASAVVTPRFKKIKSPDHTCNFRSSTSSMALDETAFERTRSRLNRLKHDYAYETCYVYAVWKKYYVTNIGLSCFGIAGIVRNGKIGFLDNLSNQELLIH